ncbi:MAG: biotin--[acetyl-CoA-carboxylase] ligase [Chloroflexi bacterium]|nr:biotin--[acetyl-CoA-carboxylase] ligase [Chloroflexota bacterium]
MYEPSALERIEQALSTCSIGHRILYRPVVTSTMDVAREEAERGAPEGTVVVAEEQTAGRGRFGRRWLSIPGKNLSFSVLLYPSAWASARLSVAAPVAVLRALRQVTGLSPTLKWPNDLLLDGKKVCGILIESAFQDAEVRQAVIGIGINVNLNPSGQMELVYPATSLAERLGSPVSREEVLQSVLEELGVVYDSLKGWADAWLEWQASLETLGKAVQVRWRDQVEEGVAEGVDSEGKLLLRRADGTVIALAAGEVTFRV